jgi:hypothetical protein
MRSLMLAPVLRGHGKHVVVLKFLFYLNKVTGFFIKVNKEYALQDA